MAPDFQYKHLYDQLGEIIDEHIEWFGLLAMSVAYADESGSVQGAQAPDTFMPWVEKIKAEKLFPESSVNNLVSMFDELSRQSELTHQKVQSGTRPDVKTFEDLKSLFDAFIIKLLRLEREESLEDSGLDTETSMRSKEFMMPDLKREMERVARQGKPFTLVYTRVDSFQSISDHPSALKVITKNINKCLRTFDDAYYLENGHFVLSLKQTDIFGAQAATMRIQQGLRTDDANDNISMSYCLAEPVPEDNMKELIDNMRSDLSKYEDEKDIVLKFLEVSPLQRYIDAIS